MLRGLWGEMRRCRQGASSRQGRRAVISARTRTLHAARCELVRSVLLIASPTAAAREDAASRVRLHETNGVGAWGHRGLATWFSSYGGTSTPFWDSTFGGPRGECTARHIGWNAFTCTPAPGFSGTFCLHTRVHVIQPLLLPHSGQGAGGSCAPRS